MKKDIGKLPKASDMGQEEGVLTENSVGYYLQDVIYTALAANMDIVAKYVHLLLLETIDNN